MTTENKKSPFGFIFLAALIIAVGGVWFLQKRSAAPVTPIKPLAAAATPSSAPAALPPIVPGALPPIVPAADSRPDSVVHVPDTTVAPRPAAELLSPQAPVASPNDPAIRERALIRALHAALKQAGEPSAESQTEDLLAVLFFSRPEPLPEKPSAADLDSAITRRQQVNGGILAGSSVFLSPSQLKIYGQVLQGEVEHLRTLRAGAR
jgi:hypothetical protein